MKSSYELAMERLNKSTPLAKLNEAQKKEIAEIDSKFAAKIAEREIFLKGEIHKAMVDGKFEEVQVFERQLQSERKALEAEMEEKKDAVRQRKK